MDASRTLWQARRNHGEHWVLCGTADVDIVARVLLGAACPASCCAAPQRACWTTWSVLWTMASTHTKCDEWDEWLCQLQGFVGLGAGAAASAATLEGPLLTLGAVCLPTSGDFL